MTDKRPLLHQLPPSVTTDDPFELAEAIHSSWRTLIYENGKFWDESNREIEREYVNTYVWRFLIQCPVRRKKHQSCLARQVDEVIYALKVMAFPL